MESLFFTALALSGMSVAWHVWLGDHPSTRTALKQRSTFFVCGVCQVFWGSLLISIALSPFELPWRESLKNIHPWLNGLVTWQAIAMTAYLMRYLFLFILESVKEKLQKNV